LTDKAHKLLEHHKLVPIKPPPYGSAQTYEKPETSYAKTHYKLMNKQERETFLRARIQDELNLKKRRELLNQEAMAQLGGVEAQDYEDMPTEEIDSDEGDVFLRKRNFELLARRFEKHRKEHPTKGNDIKYNTYVLKLHRMARSDLGIDVEGYKDYINTLEKM